MYTYAKYIPFISLTILIISSNVYFVKGVVYPGTGIADPSLEVLKGGKLAELISIVARGTGPIMITMMIFS
jgi:hypothetical protein